MGAQSHVAVSFQNPVFTSQVGTLGSISILEAIRTLDYDVKFYQASSSEMFGGEGEVTLSEKSPFDPKALMLHLKFLLIILQKFIESRTTCFV